MILESSGKSPSEFIFFFIKSSEEELFQEQGIRTFLSAFDKLSELQNRTVHLMLGCQVQRGDAVEIGLQLWKRLCSTFTKVKFVPPTQVIGFFDLIQSCRVEVSGELVRRPALNEIFTRTLMVNQIICLQGGRQVGKTTFIKDFISETAHIYLEL